MSLPSGTVQQCARCHRPCEDTWRCCAYCGAPSSRRPSVRFRRNVHQFFAYGGYCTHCGREKAYVDRHIKRHRYLIYGLPALLAMATIIGGAIYALIPDVPTIPPTAVHRSAFVISPHTFYGLTAVSVGISVLAQVGYAMAWLGDILGPKSRQILDSRTPFDP